MGTEDPLKTARNLSYRFLALRPRSRAELASYLGKKKGVPEEAVALVLEELEALGYLDDGKFAQGYARYLVEYRGLGPFAVRFELRKKGVSEDDISPAVDGLYGNEGDDALAVALRLAERKLASMKGVDELKKKRRLTDLLKRKGFPSDIIRSVIRKLT